MLPQPDLSPRRISSLDVMRGLIMVLLMMESTGMYEHLFEGSEHTWFSGFMVQFFHHPWHGLRFWDLIQPGFMFIAGASLAASLVHQEQRGVPWSGRFQKVLKRSVILFLLGVLNYAVRPKGLSFELWNVLTQLSFTTLVAFLVFQWPVRAQLLTTVFLLMLTEVLYRFSAVAGFDQPFTDQHNFGNYVDLLLMNKINPDGWVAINCLPTACHTIWGALAGKLLLSDTTPAHKIRLFIIGGATLLVLGYGMDLTITPIIKRIATVSFTLASGGWCVLAVTLAYWWVDLKNHQTSFFFVKVVGMNSLFIYLFFEIVGYRWFNGYITSIVSGLLAWTPLSSIGVGVASATVIFVLEWSLCLFLYRRNIFIRI